MRAFLFLDFRLKSVYAALKYALPLIAAVFFIGYLTDWQSSAKSGDESPVALDNSMTARFDSPACGDNWDNRFANATNGSVYAVAVDAGGNLYIGGDFTQVGGVTANHIARWNGLNWSALGVGTDDYVSAIAVSGNDVYAGGEFKNAGGAPAKYIAKWNGANWAALGDGMDANVASIAVSGSNIYAGGYFTTAGGAAANYIAKWNGSAWSPLGSGTSDVVNSVVVSGNDVYAGGGFEMAGGVETNYIAKWNGATWSSVGGGTDGDVYAMAISGSNLYVGGSFYKAGGVLNTTRIARWNGTNWSALGSGANDTIYTIATSGNDVYAGGYFTKASQVTANRVSKWNGVNWSALDGGTNNPAIALAATGSDVYTGGFFSTAGCRASGNVARYFLQSFSGGGNGDWHNSANWNNGAIPDGTTDVNIGTVDVSITNSNAAVRDLRVDAGRNLTIAANRTLTVNGNLNLLGSVTGAGTLVITNCSPAAISRETDAGYVRSSLMRCVNNTGAFTFPVGTTNGYTPVQISNVAGGGNFTVKANQGAYASPAAGLSTANRLQRFWDLTNGGITSADVQFNYLPGDVLGTESTYKIIRVNGETAESVPGTVNTANHTATANSVSNFSPWTLGEYLAPTAASVSVGGRVLTQTGRGVFGAQVILIKSSGETRYARTNPFGFYNFGEVAAGETYTVNIVHKNYMFATRVVTVTEDLTELDFTAEP